MPLSTIFQLIYPGSPVSFIGGGNQSAWRKPQTYHKSLTNLYPFFCIFWGNCYNFKNSLLKHLKKKRVYRKTFINRPLKITPKHSL
jgi:hypothetical protein